MSTTTPSTPPIKPKWGRIGSAMRRTSAKFTKSSGKPGSDGDSDSTSLRQTPSFEAIQTTTSSHSSPSPSPTPPPTKSKIGRIGRAMRRASTKLSVSRQGTPSAERDSDTLSLKPTASYEVIPSAAPSLSVPVQSVEATLPSPIAESPAREAEAIQREIVGPSPLAQLSLPPQEDEVPSTPEEPAVPPADVEDQPSPVVEHVPPSAVDSPPEDPQALVHSVEHDPPSIVDSSSGSVEVAVNDHPEVDVSVSPQPADPVSTPATEESLVLVDPPAVDAGAFVADFDHFFQDPLVPGALTFKSRDPLYYHPNASVSTIETDSEEEERDREPALQLDASTHSEIVNPFLPTDSPATLVDVHSSPLEAASPQVVLPAVVAPTAGSENGHEQTMDVRQTEHTSSSSLEDTSMLNPFTSTEVSEVLPPPPHVAPIVEYDAAPIPSAKEEKNIPVNIYLAVPPTSLISQPPPAYTVDHFPSPTPNAHLVADPEKATVASRLPKKEATPSLKSVLKPPRPISTVSTTNNGFEDFRVKTLVVVVGAMASIVATAMLFFRR